MEVVYTCRDECKAKVILIDDLAGPPGWQYLPISKRWRCPQCALQLEQVNNEKPPDTAGSVE